MKDKDILKILAETKIQERVKEKNEWNIKKKEENKKWKERKEKNNGTNKNKVAIDISKNSENIIRIEIVTKSHTAS